MANELAVKLKTVQDLISAPKMKARLAAALPRCGIDADRFVQMGFTAIQRQPKLATCEPASLLGCLVMSAQSGLDPSGVTGEAYLVPYGQTATFIPGYRGLMKLAYNSGRVASIMAQVVREGDEFEYELGLNEKLRHVPKATVSKNAAEDWKAITHAYCVAKLKDGGRVFVVMTKSEVEAIRARSKSGTSGPWVTDPAAMARKTVVRQTMKFLPLSAEAARVVTEDENADAGLGQNLSDLLDGDVPTTAEGAVQADATVHDEPPKVPAGGDPDDPDNPF